jgi:pectate lyase
LVVFSWAGLAHAQTGLPAFPGAEGFGASATGGRGGRVIKVTNLNASGAGSLQAALNVNAPRIIVFDVSGVIRADEIVIPYGNVTIAGQTAPGGGITIAGRFTAEYGGGVDNLIVRHIRVRPPEFSGGNGAQFDGLQFSTSENVILDHMSVSFGVDETVDLYSARNVTVQWSTIEMSATEGHPEGSHNYGLINGPDGGNITLHHNLFAHHNKRAPALSVGPAETINNVVYNLGDAWLHHNPASGPFVVIGNHFKDGPSANLLPFFLDAEAVGPDLAYYFDANFMDNPGNHVGEVEPWTIPPGSPNMQYVCEYFNGGNCEDYRVFEKPDFSGIAGYVQTRVESQEDALENTLNGAGAFPRDVVTRTTVAETRNRSGSWGARIPADLMDGLDVESPPVDSDDDGMADAWERENGLDPADGADHSSVMPSGYTAIEVYINELADSLVGVTACENCKTPNPPENLTIEAP